MKRLYITIAIYFAALTAFSQPVLTYEDLKLKLNDNLNIAMADYMNHGDSGENVTWDFSLLVQTGTIEYVVSEGDSVLPNTNFTITDDQQRKDHYYENTLGRYYYGTSFLGTIHLYYKKPGLTVFFPLEYGKTVYDTSDGFVAFFGDTTLDRSIQVYKCDGYGTIITPKGTFNNAIRVHITQYILDSFWNKVPGTEIHSYMWYIKDYSMPVVSIAQILSDSQVVLDGANFAINPPLNTFSKNNLISEIELYPNPTSNILNLKYDPANRITCIEIIDLAGKHILQSIKLNNTTDSGEIKIDVSNLSNGVYFLKTTTSEGVRSAKFTVSK